MKKQLITVSAICALMAGTSIVAAQRGPDSSSGGMSAAPAAPAEKMAPPAGRANPSANESRGAMKPEANSDRRAEDRSQGMPDRRSSSPDNRMRSEDNSPTRSPSQAQSSPQRYQSPSQAQSGGTSPNDRNASGGSQTNAHANLSADQRTRIRATVLAQPQAPKISRNEVNFNIRVGTVVPRTVTVAPLPAAVVEIHPAWRGYSYILVGDEIVILEPASLRIVAIIPA